MTSKSSRTNLRNKLFRKIEADIKERNRKRPRPARFEKYIDRDRSISVAIGGEADIRKTMTSQRNYLSKNKIMNTEQHSELKILLMQAEHELNKGAHTLALSYLNRAFQLNPENPETLSLRSACYVLNSDFELALKEIESVLQIDRYKGRGFCTKGDALYHLGDFEHALLYYHRALPFCTNDEDPKQGIQRCEKAIINALIGEGVAGHFIDMSHIIECIPVSIFGLPWSSVKLAFEDLQHEEEQKNLITELNSTSSTSRMHHHHSQQPRELHHEKQMQSAAPRHRYHPKIQQKKLLGKLSGDLDYLEELLLTIQVKDKKLKKEAQNGILFLKNRQEFWSQLKPSYKQK